MPRSSESQSRIRGPFRIILLPFQKFVQAESFSGFLLLFFTAAALLWANLDSISNSYTGLWHMDISLGIGSFLFTKPVHFYINDSLMSVFFLVVGLEIKREIIAGELSSRQLALLPILAAAGGMLFPALIYASFNFRTSGIHGWGIPTATDIAFALGIMSLLGDRISQGLKVFLAALAIADDLGAVILIAVFYTTELSLMWLAAAILIFALQITANLLNIYRLYVYLFLGFLLWIAMLKAGIHPTIAGVFTAIAIPARNKITGDSMRLEIANYLREFEPAFRSDEHPLSNEREQEGIYAIEDEAKKAQTPLKRLEDKLHPWVTYFIMPVFALANAGVVLDGEFIRAYSSYPTIGVIAGLVFGKPVGITLFSYLAVRLGLASLPEGESWKRIISAGSLAGIGFTMSIFITGLAFTDPQLINYAKVGILSGSIISGVLGYLLLRGK